MTGDLPEQFLKIFPEKWKGLQAVSDTREVIAALTIDQRSALRSLFAKATGMELGDVPRESLERFKEAVSRILTPHASTIPLDPEYDLPAALQRARNCGLLFAYEQTGYDTSIPGRSPRLPGAQLFDIHYKVNCRVVEAAHKAVDLVPANVNADAGSLVAVFVLLGIPTVEIFAPLLQSEKLYEIEYRYLLPQQTCQGPFNLVRLSEPTAAEGIS